MRATWKHFVVDSIHIIDSESPNTAIKRLRVRELLYELRFQFVQRLRKSIHLGASEKRVNKITQKPRDHWSQNIFLDPTKYSEFSCRVRKCFANFDKSEITFRFRQENRTFLAIKMAEFILILTLWSQKEFFPPLLLTQGSYRVLALLCIQFAIIFPRFSEISRMRITFDRNCCERERIQLI